MAGLLQRNGLRPGTAVGLLGATTRTLVTAIQAVWLAGGSVTVLTPVLRPGTLGEHYREAVSAARLEMLLVCPPLVTDETDVAGARLMVLDDTLGAGCCDSLFIQPRLSSHDVAVRQFTSGSTSAPKAVQITHGNLFANITAIKKATRHEEAHRCLVSWLPLFHDMGLVGFVALPMTCGGCGVVLHSPEQFLACPQTWLESVSSYRATATAAPNFAFGLAGRMLPSSSDLDLSSLMVVLNGGEPIDTGVVQRFSQTTRGLGFNPSTIVCGYGMAEATLAVSLVPMGRGLTYTSFDAASIEIDQHARITDGRNRVLRLPLLGPPLPGVEVRVVDPESGQVLNGKRVGELQVRGDSVADTYVGEPDPDAFHDGWFRSGDLGLLTDGEIVVCGRRKEVVIIGGRNIFPYEAERAACRVPGIRPGRVAAFRGTAEGGETLLIAVESREGDIPQLRRNIAREVLDQVGVRPGEVVVLPPGTLPKTTSGKMRRGEVRRRFLTGELLPGAVR